MTRHGLAQAVPCCDLESETAGYKRERESLLVFSKKKGQVERVLCSWI